MNFRNLFISMWVFVAGANADSLEKPNFLIFIADDCSYHDIGCYGNEQIKTPNIDSFAGDGLRFEHCYNSSAMCAPTRMSLYTGIHPVRNGGHPNHSRVYDDVRSMPQYLGELGYQVAIMGKRHYAPAANFPFEVLKDGKRVKGSDGVDISEIGAFMDRNVDSQWCLVVASNEPHTPWDRGDASIYDPNELILPPYMVDTPQTRADLCKYYAEITYMDNQFGQCMQMLKQHQLVENTVVVFLSEQGSSFPHCKWTCYDTGLRSAGIVQWPGVVEAGAETEAMIQYVDILPTFIELAGGQIEEGLLDGKSFASVLKGQSDSHRDYVYGTQTSRGIFSGPEAFGIRSIRDSRFRLVWNLNPENEFQNLVSKKTEFFHSWEEAAANGDAFAKEQVSRFKKRAKYELYDLEGDPWEMQNIVGNPEYAEVVARLEGELSKWMTQQGDEGAATEMKAGERHKRALKKKAAK